MDSKTDKIIKRRSNLSTAKRAILEKRLRGEHHSDTQQIVIPRRTQQTPVPLSTSQQRLWFLQQLEPQSSVYNEFACIQLKGILNFAALEKSFNEIVKRHESLRTSFETLDEQPVQVIHPTLSIKLPVVNLCDLPQVLQNAEIERLTTEIDQKPFDLTSTPLLRVSLLRTSEQEHLLLLVIHHIVCDGWSIQVLNKELAAIYEAFSAEQSSPLAELPVQYADYSIWQNQWLQGEREKTQLSYWKQQLKDASSTLSLSTDHQRPPIQSYKGAAKFFKLSSHLSDRIRVLSNQQGITLFMTLLAAFQAQLYRYTNQEDICIGSPIANRNHADIEGLIGFFVNTLALRTDLSGNPSFLELLNRVRDVCVGAYAHADIPFERLVGELHPERNLSHTPLFQVTFALQEDTKKDLVLPGLTLQWLDNHNETAKFDLTLYVVDSKPELWGWWEYNTDLFDATTIERMVGHFTNLLEGIVAQPEQLLSELPLLTEPERQTLLINWNDTTTDYPQDKCIHQLFEAQVEKTPDKIAVVFENQQLTYRELNTKANQLAHYLRSLGVKSEVLVGICVERSLDMVIGLLAILKAGGAYVPLDPNYPQERIAFILEDTQASVLLIQASLLGAIPQHQAQVVCLDTDWHLIAQQSLENLCSKITTNNLAYIIYTSGSTGKPKGVQIPHSALSNFLYSMREAPGLTSSDTLLAVTTYSFDIAALELFLPIIVGARLVVASREIASDGIQLSAKLIDSKATVMQATPATWQLLLAAGWEGNDQLKILCGGEALPTHLASQLLQRCACLWNMYGPTETTIWSAASQIKADSNIIQISHPIANTQLYILDQHNQLVPVGVAGELCIGGEGLARGYFHRSDLTAEKFIPNPFSKQASRLYKTGDLARYLPNGDIEYLGRIDNQVKVRGFRIELGEIETVISQYPAVRETVVLVCGDSLDSQRIVAYVVEKKEQTLEFFQLRKVLESKLPNYMVPNSIVILEALPLTPNGKIDRKALRATDIISREVEETYVAPQTNIEKQLANIWSEVLGLETIGINDSFFTLGGHSLLATKVISRINKNFDIELPLRQLFEFPTLGKLAKSIEGEKISSKPDRPIQRVSRNIELPLSFGQQRLWFINQLDPNSFAYNGTSTLLMQGTLKVKVLEDSVNEIVRRHEVLRTYFAAIKGQAIQKIIPVLKIPLSIVDLQNLPEIERQAEVQRLTTADAQQPFNFTEAPLFRLTLLRRSTREHILLITMHHIISDAWSAGIFIQELSTIYKAFSTGEPTPLTELPIQYADFAAWQQQSLKQEILDGQLAYWKQHLEGAKTVLELPTDKPRSQLQTSAGKKYFFALSKELSHSLEKFSQQQGVTLFMTLLAAFNTLLYHYTKQEDILIGSPIANRNCSEIEGLIGFFINTLVFRTNLSNNPSFRELLQQVREVALGGYTHQDLPFDKLVAELKLERNSNRSPLFQVWFVLQNAPVSNLELEGLNLNLIDIESGMVRHDLNLDISETSEGIKGFIEYKIDLFNAATIAQMAKLFENLLEIVVKQPKINLKELVEMLNESQKQQQILANQEFQKTRRQKLGKLSRKAPTDIS